MKILIIKFIQDNQRSWSSLLFIDYFYYLCQKQLESLSMLCQCQRLIFDNDEILAVIQQVFSLKLCDDKIVQSSLHGRLSRHKPAVQSRGRDYTVVNKIRSTKERVKCSQIFIRVIMIKAFETTLLYQLIIQSKLYLVTSISWLLILSFVVGVCCTSSQTSGFKTGHTEDKHNVMKLKQKNKKKTNIFFINYFSINRHSWVQTLIQHIHLI